MSWHVWQLDFSFSMCHAKVAPIVRVINHVVGFINAHVDAKQFRCQGCEYHNWVAALTSVSLVAEAA